MTVDAVSVVPGPQHAGPGFIDVPTPGYEGRHRSPTARVDCSCGIGECWSDARLHFDHCAYAKDMKRRFHAGR